jgi:thiol-disulfide isomerase/thioredoxin
LSDANGAPLVYYADSKENVSIILFWATWCPYCLSLMPHLQEVANEYKDSAVKFYALNVWEDGDPKKYFQENEFTFHLMLMADLVAEDYGVLGTPGLFVIDQSHRVVYARQLGEDDVDVKIAVREAIQRTLVTD